MKIKIDKLQDDLDNCKLAADAEKVVSSNEYATAMGMLAERTSLLRYCADDLDAYHRTYGLLNP